MKAALLSEDWSEAHCLQIIADVEKSHHFSRSLRYSLPKPRKRLPFHSKMSMSSLSVDDCIAQIKSWNQAPLVPVRRCVHSLITEQTNKTPDALAVDAWDGQLSYRELGVLSDRLASHLGEKGVKKEVKVPICFEKSIWAIVSILAILKAGGAFVPLDPAYPIDRLRLIVSATRAPILLASAGNISLLAQDVADVVEVSQKTSTEWAEVVSDSMVEVGPDNAAYVLYTSGSTGTPKG